MKPCSDKISAKGPEDSQSVGRIIPEILDFSQTPYLPLTMANERLIWKFESMREASERLCVYVIQRYRGIKCGSSFYESLLASLAQQRSVGKHIERVVGQDHFSTQALSLKYIQLTQEFVFRCSQCPLELPLGSPSEGLMASGIIVSFQSVIIN